MNKPNNPGAFPTLIQGRDGDHISYDFTEGMTLRDYFAGQALTAYAVIPNKEISVALLKDADNKNMTVQDYIARECYMFADAMLKERDK